MKPTEAQLKDLAERISLQHSAKGLTYAQIASEADVDASQVWRICNGEFKTISNNVVQVCKALEIEAETDAPVRSTSERWWSRIEVSIRALWDGTPEGARRIQRMCETIAELRSR